MNFQCCTCNKVFDWATRNQEQSAEAVVKSIGGMRCVGCLLVEDKVNLFVVIRHDRHSDDTITIHVTDAGAREAIENFKASYAEYGCTWEAREWDGDNGWLYGVRSHDDGPWARIEMRQVLR